ncbi:MAG: hypothetical protein ACREFR_02575, partial [Limisphaerales bacterium]
VYRSCQREGIVRVRENAGNPFSDRKRLPRDPPMLHKKTLQRIWVCANGHLRFRAVYPKLTRIFEGC